MMASNAILVALFILLIVIMLVLIAVTDEIVRKKTLCGKDLQKMCRKCKCKKKKEGCEENTGSTSPGSRRSSRGTGSQDNGESSRPLVDYKGLVRQFSQASLSQQSSATAHADENRSHTSGLLAPGGLPVPGHGRRPRADSLSLTHSRIYQPPTGRPHAPEITVILTPPQSDSTDNLEGMSRV